MGNHIYFRVPCQEEEWRACRPRRSPGSADVLVGIFASAADGDVGVPGRGALKRPEDLTSAAKRTDTAH